MAKKKDWYWEAESDKIAADLDLLLIRSPDEGPTQGLECVGLYFLMTNLMWRSPRTGYLCDPAKEGVPMSDTDLAVLVGRDSAVVQRVLNVLLVREMFSKTLEGIIYSRGILRRLALRAKRSKAGKKGGLRSQDLLKQKVEQNTEQTLRLRIGIGIDSSEGGSGGNLDPPEFSIAFLAQEAAFAEGWGGQANRIAKWHVVLDDLSRAGFSDARLAGELAKKPLKSEPPWDFLKRLLKASKPTQDIQAEIERRIAEGK